MVLKAEVSKNLYQRLTTADGVGDEEKGNFPQGFDGFQHNLVKIITGTIKIRYSIEFSNTTYIFCKYKSQ